jgi:biotin synthase
LSAGRTAMTEELQALCFLGGANSIFYGDTLLTTPNPEKNEDMELFDKLGIVANGEQTQASSDTAAA